MHYWYNNQILEIRWIIQFVQCTCISSFLKNFTDGASHLIYFFKAFPDLPLLVLDAGFLPLGVAPFLPPALLDLGADFLEPKAGFLAEIFLPAEAPLETFFPALALATFFGALDAT